MREPCDTPHPSLHASLMSLHSSGQETFPDMSRSCASATVCCYGLIRPAHALLNLALHAAGMGAHPDPHHDPDVLLVVAVTGPHVHAGGTRGAGGAWVA